ncbi:Protein of unknown function [Ekhidna lutea]|uniref:DUF3667 domain-containing protein n=1 Tax=Ekhidna lutea TaxID=447679 RepID=A0A239IPN1_EKHLU|nr:DUF3667 domain-containing protein [Ekhidna lutea]SNS95332.1 Protein of unknown function [Ekhidna lutea]
MGQRNKHNCLNCGSAIAENYCPNCGQSTTIHRITFRETINDFFSSTFALEGPLLLTIKLLILNPGRLFREFIEGKRKTYYKPVAFFVVLTALYLIIRSASGFDPFHNQPQMKGRDVPERAMIFIEAGRFMVAHINHIMFFLVFAIGLSNKLFFYRKYNLAEYITTGFYISGIYILVGIAQILFSVYVFYISPQLNMVFLFAYLFYASFSFHKNTSFMAIVKYLLLSVFAIILYVVFGFSFSLLVVS